MVAAVATVVVRTQGVVRTVMVIAGAVRAGPSGVMARAMAARVGAKAQPNAPQAKAVSVTAREAAVRVATLIVSSMTEALTSNIRPTMNMRTRLALGMCCCTIQQTPSGMAPTRCNHAM